MNIRQGMMVLTSGAVLVGGVALAAALVHAADTEQGHGSVLTEMPEAEPVEQLDEPKDVLKKYRPFEVVKRTEALEEGGYFPCTDCHDNDTQQPNPTIRELEDEHDSLVLAHGGGRFWCLTCHHLDNRDSLRSLKDQPISYDDSYLLCGQCHFQRQKDFFHGAHGKRVGSWQGERVLTNCTGCHDAHAPQIKPAKPFAPPKVRSGLERDTRPIHHHTPHARIISRHSDEGHGTVPAEPVVEHGEAGRTTVLDEPASDVEPKADADAEGAAEVTVEAPHPEANSHGADSESEPEEQQ